MATIIQIQHEVGADALRRVQDVLFNAQNHDPNWNGAVFVVERDDFTCIPGRDDADAVRLLNQIHRAIDGIV